MQRLTEDIDAEAAAGEAAARLVFASHVQQLMQEELNALYRER